MSKTVTKRFRCSEAEAEELERRAKEQHITVSGLIRQRLNLDAEKKAVYAEARSDKTTAMVADNLVDAVDPEVREKFNQEMDRISFERRVNELSRRMPRSNAERLARKELG